MYFDALDRRLALIIHPKMRFMIKDKIGTVSLLNALSACSAACEHCATACLDEYEVKMLTHCILLDRDCADICRLTATLIARGSLHGQHLLRECAEVCGLCAVECEKHAHMQHCKECAQACRNCETACREFFS
jgi:hypothetical protein